MTFVSSARTRTPLLLLLGCLLGPTAMPSRAHAEPTKEEIDEARQQFQRGIEMEAGKNWTGALKVFREVAQVRMTPNVRYHIALCEENLGKLVTALGGYELTLQESESMEPEFRTEVENRMNALKARIPKLVLVRGTNAEAATISLDGVTLGSKSLGVEIPLDPGPHVIQATSAELEDVNETVDIPERKTKTLTIEMVAKEVAPADVPVAPPMAPLKKDRTLAYIVGGVGAGLLVTSGVFYILQRGKDSDLQSLCGGDHNCTNAEPRQLSAAELSRANDMNDKLKLYTTLTTVTAVGGLLGVGVGVVLYVTAPQTGGSPGATSEPAPADPGDDYASPTESAPAESESGISLRIVPSAPMAELGGLSLIGQF